MADFINRDLEKNVAAATPPAAVVIIGPRRCGKTTFLRQLVKTLSGETRWFNCDYASDAQQLRIGSKSDAEALLRLAPNIVIDEAQRVPDIELLLKMLVDCNETLPSPSRIFVTGSSALELAASTAESAVGRIKQRRMWPLSMHEIAGVRSWAYVQENLGSFMVYGTNPLVVKDPENAADILADYTDGILFKDLFQLAEIRRNSKFVDLVTMLCRRIGSEVNFESLGRDLGLSRMTVVRYVDLLELCSIVKVVGSYAKNLDNELKKGKKIYFTDLGIRNALLGDFSPISSRPDAGAIWENFFFMERLKMHDTLRDRKRMYFWRTKGVKPAEVDLLEVEDQSMQAFECKLSSKAHHKSEKEFVEAYPDCGINVATPANCLRYFDFSPA